MPPILGILVNTAENIHYVRELTQAACAKGKRVWIFFTGDGVAMARPSLVKELARMAQITVDNVGGHATHSRRAKAGPTTVAQAETLTLDTFLAGCDRYVVF